MSTGVEVGKGYVNIIPRIDKSATAALSGVMGPAAGTAGMAAGSLFGSKLLAGINPGVLAAGAAVAAVGVGAVKIVGDAVAVGQEFDKSMSQVAATMGKTMEEVENEVVTTEKFTGSLRDFAKEMGRTTAFSARQASEALNYMALAGYDAKTSVEMLPTVLDLAAAGSMELASASDMVTDAQSALGLSIEDTRKMVDQMAKASSKSNTSVEQLGSAFLTVGGTAKMMKGGTEELATVLGILADNGIKGSEGGTALRNILLSLSAPTDKAAEQLEALGISVFDAEGNMRGMQDIITDLNGALSSLTEEERTKAIATIFNKRDLKSVNALLGTSVDRWEELGVAISDAEGAASKMAETQLDNLAGDVTLFQSAFEGLQIAISDKVTPVLRDFVQFATDGVTTLTSIIDGSTSLLDVFGNIGAGVTDWIATSIENLLDALPGAIDGFAEMIDNLLSGLANSAPDMEKNSDDFWGRIGAALERAWPRIKDALGRALTRIGDSIIRNGPQILKSGLTMFGKLALGVAKSLPGILKEVGKIALNILLAIRSLPGKLLEFGGNMIKNLINGIKKDPRAIGEALGRMIRDAITSIFNFRKDMLNSGVDFIKNLIEGLKREGPKIPENIAKFLYDFINNLPIYIQEFLTAGQQLIGGFIDGLLGKKTAVSTTMGDVVSGANTKARSYEGTFKNTGSGLTTKLGEGISSKSKFASDKSSGVANAANRAAGIFGSFNATGKQSIVDYANGVWSRHTTARNNAAAVAREAKNNMKADTYSSGRNFTHGFSNGILSDESLRKLRAAAARVASIAKGSLSAGINEGSPSRDTMKSGRYFTQGFAIGIEQEEKLAVNAADKLAQATMDALNTQPDFALNTDLGAVRPVVITGNEFNVRDDYDIELIGYELNKQVARQTVGTL